MDVDLVLVPVTITDPMNRLVTGLEKENFILLDNGEKQAIQHFSSEDAPISLGVIFDMSGSMANKIEKSREAVVEFFKTANPEDEFFLIAFNDKPTLISDFTSSVEQVQGQLVYTVPKGRTALLDAIYLGMAKMRQAKQQRKALLIISDGGDNRSRYTENEIKSMVREADVQIYAIGFFDQSPRSDEERFGPQLLAEVTDVTGGRTFTVDNPNEMSDVAAKIGVELRNQYVLGYRPSQAGARWQVAQGAGETGHSERDCRNSRYMQRRGTMLQVSRGNSEAGSGLRRCLLAAGGCAAAWRLRRVSSAPNGQASQQARTRNAK